MRAADVDLVATSGTSALHRALPVAKLIGLACVLGIVVVSPDLAVLAGVALTLAALAVWARLPGGLLAVRLTSIYPAPACPGKDVYLLGCRGSGSQHI